MMELQPGSSIGGANQEISQSIPDRDGRICGGYKNPCSLLRGLPEEREGFFEQGCPFPEGDLLVVKGGQAAEDKKDAGRLLVEAGDFGDEGVSLMAGEGAGYQDLGEKLPGFSAQGLGHAGDQVRVEEIPCVQDRNSIALGQRSGKKPLGEGIYLGVTIEKR